MRGLTDVLGFAGGADVLTSAFAALDVDGSGSVELEELDAWVRGRAPVRKEAVREAIQAGLVLVPAEEEPPWDLTVLRQRLTSALASLQLVCPTPSPWATRPID